MNQFYEITKSEARVLGLSAVTSRLPLGAEYRSWVFDECSRMRDAGRKAEVVNDGAGVQLYADLNYLGIDPTNKDRLLPSTIWEDPVFITGYELAVINTEAARVEKARKANG